MKDNKTLRITVADAKSFERSSFKTYTLDEENGVTVVVASDPKDSVVKAQAFIFDQEKNPAWNFQNADSYVKASVADVNKLALATKGSATFKTLAAAAIDRQAVDIDKVRSGLRLASIDRAIYDNLLKANIDAQQEIDHNKVEAAVGRY